MDAESLDKKIMKKLATRLAYKPREGEQIKVKNPPANGGPNIGDLVTVQTINSRGITVEWNGKFFKGPPSDFLNKFGQPLED